MIVILESPAMIAAGWILLITYCLRLEGSSSITAA
jgi:hypothetical protein